MLLGTAEVLPYSRISWSEPCIDLFSTANGLLSLQVWERSCSHFANTLLSSHHSNAEVPKRCSRFPDASFCVFYHLFSFLDNFLSSAFYPSMKFPISVIMFLILRALFLCYFFNSFLLFRNIFSLSEKGLFILFSSSAAIHCFFPFSIYKLCTEVKYVDLNIGLYFGYQMIPL